MDIVFHPIGYIHSQYTDISKTPKNGEDSPVEALIELDSKYLEAISDMEVGKKYIVLFYFHKSKGFKQKARLHGDGPLTGLFSTHSPNRPNPIGISTITVIDIDDNIIKFRGVDMLDGTPVLDIKQVS